MLDHDKQASQAIITLMRAHITLARDLGDFATEDLLKEHPLEK